MRIFDKLKKHCFEKNEVEGFVAVSRRSLIFLGTQMGLSGANFTLNPKMALKCVVDGVFNSLTIYTLLT